MAARGSVFSRRQGVSFQPSLTNPRPGGFASMSSWISAPGTTATPSQGSGVGTGHDEMGTRSHLVASSRLAFTGD